MSGGYELNPRQSGSSISASRPTSMVPLNTYNPLLPGQPPYNSNNANLSWAEQAAGIQPPPSPKPSSYNPGPSQPYFPGPPPQMPPPQMPPPQMPPPQLAPPQPFPSGRRNSQSSMANANTQFTNYQTETEKSVFEYKSPDNDYESKLTISAELIEVFEVFHTWFIGSITLLHVIKMEDIRYFQVNTFQPKQSSWTAIKNMARKFSLRRFFWELVIITLLSILQNVLLLLAAGLPGIDPTGVIPYLSAALALSVIVAFGALLSLFFDGLSFLRSKEWLLKVRVIDLTVIFLTGIIACGLAAATYSLTLPVHISVSVPTSTSNSLTFYDQLSCNLAAANSSSTQTQNTPVTTTGPTNPPYIFENVCDKQFRPTFQAYGAFSLLTTILVFASLVWASRLPVPITEADLLPRKVKITVHFLSIKTSLILGAPATDILAVEFQRVFVEEYRRWNQEHLVRRKKLIPVTVTAN